MWTDSTGYHCISQWRYGSGFFFFTLTSYLPILETAVLGGVLTSLKTVQTSPIPIIQPCNFRHSSTSYVYTYLSQILAFPVWPTLHLHNLKAKLSSHKYCPLSLLCFKVALQNLSTTKMNTRTGNPCHLSALQQPHQGTETFRYLIVFSSMKLRIKFIHFTGYCKNFCTSCKFCILGVESEWKCKIQTLRYRQSHMLCTIHRLLLLEDFPSCHCSCSLWQLQSDFCSGALFLEENMAMITIMHIMKSRSRYHSHLYGNILAFQSALFATPVCRPALEVSFSIQKVECVVPGTQ